MSTIPAHRPSKLGAGHPREPSTDSAAVGAVRARGEALAAILRREVEELAREGVAYVALGNPLYAPLLTVAGRERLAGEIDVDAVLASMIAADRAVAEGLDVPEEFRVGLDLTDSGPHLRSLIHVHSPALVALSAMAEVPTQLLMLHASFWPETMPIWEEAELVRDRAAAQRLIGLLGDEAIALLRWHGAVIVGTTLREAVFRALLAEEHASQLVHDNRALTRTSARASSRWHGPA